MILIKRSVKLIRAAFGHEGHLRAGRPPEACVRVRDSHSKLVERLGRDRYGCPERQSNDVIRDVDAVEVECVLVGAGAAYFSARGRAGLQGQKARRLTVGVWQSGYAVAIYYRSNRRIVSLQLRLGSGADRHLFFRAAGLEHDVNIDRP